MFADRTAWDLRPNAFTRRRRALEAAGVRLLDLTESNPTRCGFRYPDGWLDALADPRAAVYEPSACGLVSARAAVAEVYRSKGTIVDPGDVLLTASTSEAYSFLFRLLANPGDQILMPHPSYPLIEYLAGLADVDAVPYRLVFEGRWLRQSEAAPLASARWRLDLESCRRAITSRTRAIVIVHPHNPTGWAVTSEELAALAAHAAERRIPLIADEVFAEYLGPETLGPRTALGAPDALVFALGGVSKFLGLPQMKLAWIAMSGPPSARQQARERLEVIADTFLSVATPVQWAWPRWLAEAAGIQEQIRQRVLANRRLLEQSVPGVLPASRGEWCGLRLPQPSSRGEGGWSAVIRVPHLDDEEAFVLKLLEQDHVVVHPGYFFDFEEPGYLVVSLLPPPEMFAEAITRLGRLTTFL